MGKWTQKIGKFLKRRPRLRVLARYDAAQTTDENKRHWALADLLSPNAALLPAVRRTIRSRARYEVANNSYAKGMVLSLANYIVGTGPRLQMITPDQDLNDKIEDEFRKWAVAIGLGQKIRTMKMSETESGEVFALMETNPAVQARAKLDIRLIEADQVAAPTFAPIFDPNSIDGITCDKRGNPIEYTVLRQHPGDRLRIFGNKFDTIPAESMIHLFRADRPGQKRGLPEITAALPLFAMLRRYTLAVLSAAEGAALPSGVIYTDASADSVAADIDAMDEIEIDRNTWLTMPHGWKVGQFKAEHPTTTYPEFKNEILNEIARCLNMPFNIAAGNSSGYNYASGRLDHQAFYKSIVVEQGRIETCVLDRLLDAWLTEMILISGALPQSARMIGQEFPHKWFWDGTEHVDPAKEAKAQEIRLKNHTTTLADEYARQGKDWLREVKQQAHEREVLQKLHLVVQEETT